MKPKKKTLADDWQGLARSCQIREEGCNLKNETNKRRRASCLRDTHVQHLDLEEGAFGLSGKSCLARSPLTLARIGESQFLVDVRNFMYRWMPLAPMIQGATSLAL